MIDTAYESFVNDVAMELFGLSQKEKDMKKAQQMETVRNMSDKDYAVACMQQTANIIFSSYEQFCKNSSVKKLMQDQTRDDFIAHYLDNKIVNSDHLEEHPVYFRSYKYKPVFIAEKFISGDLDNADIKMKTQSLNVRAVAPTFGFDGIEIENRNNVDKWYPNNMPKILVYNQAKNCSTPVYDDHVSVMVVCDKENCKFTWFIMTGEKETLKNAHAGKLISAQQYFKGATESFNLEALEFLNNAKDTSSKEEKFNPSESLIKAGKRAVVSAFKEEWNDTSSIPFSKVFNNFNFDSFSKFHEAYHETGNQYRYVYYFSDAVINLCKKYSDETDGFTPVGVEIICDSTGFDKESGDFLF